MNPRQIWNDIKKLNLSESETFKRIYKITGSMNAHKFDLNLRKMRQIEARNEALDPEVLRQIKLVLLMFFFIFPHINLSSHAPLEGRGGGFVFL